MMSLIAKAIVKNKCWIVEDDGNKVGNIFQSPRGVIYRHEGKREPFASLGKLTARYNIKVDKNTPVKVEIETNSVYGYPCEHRANNILWDVPKGLPVFTKGKKSKSFFCAGYYILKFNNGWVKSYCPKLITLNRYAYAGPYNTLEEMQENLRIANGALYGTSVKPASEEI